MRKTALIPRLFLSSILRTSRATVCSRAILHGTLAIALASSLLTVSTEAHAQASALDKAQARKLYFEGLDLQKAGKFAEALDRFNRANAVFDAPTNLLRIAECHAAMGHLAEAVEAYRAVQRYPMPPNPPTAFVQAVDQGREEQKALEPRVPELKIDVTPPNVPTLSVTLDDQPLNTALLGVPRPVNPGVHKVTASAPGYTKAEQIIEVKERNKQAQVTLNLMSTGGVVYGPASTGSSPYVQISPAPGQQPGVSQAPLDKPPVYEEKARPPDSRSRTSIFIGPRVGLALAAGKYYSEDAGSISMSDIAKAGGSLGVEGGLRFARLFYFSLVLEGARYGDVTKSGIVNGNFVTGTSSASSLLVAGKFGIITNPDGFAFLADIGIGYRSFSFDTKGTVAGRASTSSSSAESAEFLVGIGMHFKAGKILRLVPKIEVGLGSFGNDRTISGGSNSISGSESHALWMIGLGGYFDINLDKRSAAAPAPAPLAPLK